MCGTTIKSKILYFSALRVFVRKVIWCDILLFFTRGKFKNLFLKTRKLAVIEVIKINADYVHHKYNDSWNLDQNLGETYEYALKWKIHDTLSRLGSSENTFTQVYVYEPETIKLNTDHYFIEQYNRQRAPQKKISRCLLASWNLDQNLGRIRNRRRHCS